MVDRRQDLALSISRKATEVQRSLPPLINISVTEKPLDTDQILASLIEMAKTLKFEHRIISEEL
jgi:hypothetical protein